LPLFFFFLLPSIFVFSRLFFAALLSFLIVCFIHIIINIYYSLLLQYIGCYYCLLFQFIFLRYFTGYLHIAILLLNTYFRPLFSHLLSLASVSICRRFFDIFNILHIDISLIYHFLIPPLPLSSFLFYSSSYCHYLHFHFARHSSPSSWSVPVFMPSSSSKFSIISPL